MKKISLWLLISLVAFGAAATDLRIYIDTGVSMYKGKNGCPKDLYKAAGSAISDFFVGENIYGKTRNAMLYVHGFFKLKKEDKLEEFTYLQHTFDGKKPDVSQLSPKNIRSIPSDWPFWKEGTDKADDNTKLSLLNTQIFKDKKDTVFVVISNSDEKYVALIKNLNAKQFSMNDNGVVYFAKCDNGVRVFLVHLPSSSSRDGNQYRNKSVALVKEVLAAAWNAAIYAEPKAELALDVDGDVRKLSVNGAPKKELRRYAPVALALNVGKLDDVKGIVSGGKPIDTKPGRYALKTLTEAKRYIIDTRIVGRNGDVVEYEPVAIRVFDGLVFDAKVKGIFGSDDPKKPAAVSGKAPLAVTLSTRLANVDGEAQWFVNGAPFAGSELKLDKDATVRCDVNGLDGKVYKKYFKVSVVQPPPPQVFAWSVKINGRELVGQDDVVFKGQERLPISIQSNTSNGNPVQWYRDGVKVDPADLKVITKTTVLSGEVVDGNGVTRKCGATVVIAPFSWSVKINGRELVGQGDVVFKGQERLPIGIQSGTSNGNPIRWYRDGGLIEPANLKEITKSAKLRCEVVDGNGMTRTCFAIVVIEPFSWSVKINGRELVGQGNVVIRGHEKLPLSIHYSTSNGNPIRWYRDEIGVDPADLKEITKSAKLRCEVVDGNGNRRTCFATIEIERFFWSVKINGRELVDRPNVVIKGQDRLPISIYSSTSNGNAIRWYRDGVKVDPADLKEITKTTVLRCEVDDGNGGRRSCRATIEIRSTPVPDLNVRRIVGRIAGAEKEFSIKRGDSKATIRNVKAPATLRVGTDVSNESEISWWLNDNEIGLKNNTIPVNGDAVIECRIIGRNGREERRYLTVEVAPPRQKLTVKYGANDEPLKKEAGVINITGNGGDKVKFFVPTSIQREELVKYRISYGDGKDGKPVFEKVEKYDWEKRLAGGKVHQIRWYFEDEEVERFTINIKQKRDLVISSSGKVSQPAEDGRHTLDLEADEHIVTFQLFGLTDPDLGRYTLIIAPVEGMEGETKRIQLSTCVKKDEEASDADAAEDGNAEQKPAAAQKPAERKPDPEREVVDGEFKFDYEFDAPSEQQVSIVYAAVPGQPDKDEVLKECRITVNPEKEKDGGGDDDKWKKYLYMGLVLAALIALGAFFYLKLSLAVTLTQGAKVQKKRMFAQEYKLFECFRDGPSIRLHIESGAKICFKAETGKQVKVVEIRKDELDRDVAVGEKMTVRKGDGLKFTLTEGSTSWTLSIRK